MENFIDPWTSGAHSPALAKHFGPGYVAGTNGRIVKIPERKTYGLNSPDSTLDEDLTRDNPSELEE
jgi:hypothetical protein